MDFTTRWLGLELAHPFMAGAGPLADDLDGVRRLEDAGASAIVLRSLFEEQIEEESRAFVEDVWPHVESHAEASTYLPVPSEFVLGSDAYLGHLRRVKEAVGIPVIASLNGVEPSAWAYYAALIEEAGADALELNVYHLSTSAAEDGRQVERRTLDVLDKVGATPDSRWRSSSRRSSRLCRRSARRPSCSCGYVGWQPCRGRSVCPWR